MKLPRRKLDASYVSDAGHTVELWFDELMGAAYIGEDIKTLYMSGNEEKLILFIYGGELKDEPVYVKITIEDALIMRKWQEHIADRAINKILEE